MTRLDHKTLLGPLLIWLSVIVAGLIGALFSNQSLSLLTPGAILLTVPALISLAFLPVVRKPWAQAVLLLIWTGFGVFATLVAGFIPQAICFLVVPAIGMLFAKERVVEGLVLAALGLCGSYLALTYAGVDGSPLSMAEQRYLSIISVAATLALTIAAMIGGTHRRLSGHRLNMNNQEALPTVQNSDMAGFREALGGGVLEFTSDGRLLAANRKARSLFGLGDNTSGISLGILADRTGVAERFKLAAEKAQRERHPVETRVALNIDPVHPASVDLRFAPVHDCRLILHAIDRSDEADRIERLQASLTVAEREAQDKTLFFAGVSHELRTPLNAIIGFSDMMKSRLFGPLPGKYAEYADMIHDSGQYMLDLIGDVLDLSKVDVGKYQLTLDTFDVSDVVRSSVKMVRPAADAAEVRLDVTLPGDDPVLISADRKALRQILLNLLSNAIKFSPKGSRISVHAAEHEGQIILAVRDRGVGMSEKELARIGEPFAQGQSGQTSDVRGSGLGLSLVRSLAELHGGRLEIDSARGEGTTAKVILPAQMAET